MRKKVIKMEVKIFGLIARKRIYSENIERGLPWEDNIEGLISVFNFPFKELVEYCEEWACKFNRRD